jgi:predicted MFS family arabinose efflux permease
VAALLVFAASNALVALVPVYGVVVGARVVGAIAGGLSWAIVMS